MRASSGIKASSGNACRVTAAKRWRMPCPASKQATEVGTPYLRCSGKRFTVGDKDFPCDSNSFARIATVEEFARLCIGKAYRSGAWPGAIAQPSAKTIYVLPPTNAKFDEELSELIKSMAPSATVLTADSCEFGINIIRFHVFHPETEADLLPGYLKAELDRVIISPTKLLHQFPSRNGQPSETVSH